MPFTLFHCAMVWPLFIAKPKRFDFLGLTIGAILPDLEIPIMFLFTQDVWRARLIMHSLLGALTVDLFLSIILTIYVAPRILSSFYDLFRDNRAYMFAGLDVASQRKEIAVVAYSSLIGTTSHVVLDLFTHIYNPVLYPFFSGENMNLLLLGEREVSSIIVSSVVGLAFLYLAYRYWWKQSR